MFFVTRPLSATCRRKFLCAFPNRSETIGLREKGARQNEQNKERQGGCRENRQGCLGRPHDGPGGDGNQSEGGGGQGRGKTHCQAGQREGRQGGQDPGPGRRQRGRHPQGPRRGQVGQGALQDVRNQQGPLLRPCLRRPLEGRPPPLGVRNLGRARATKASALRLPTSRSGGWISARRSIAPGILASAARSSYEAPRKRRAVRQASGGRSPRGAPRQWVTPARPQRTSGGERHTRRPRPHSGRRA